MKLLDLTRFPLTESSLVEASAGTGKTFSIALLYLRALAGIGRSPLPVESLLVVTFTVAATEELKGRIHQQLLDALAWFDQPPSSPESSPLDQVCAGVAPELRAVTRARIAAGLRNLDQAAVMTIHSWAIQALKQHPLSGLAPVNSELVASHWSIQQRLIVDYWRHHFYGAPAHWAAQLVPLFAVPADLAAALRLPLQHPQMAILDDQPGMALEALFDQLAEQSSALDEKLERTRRRLALECDDFMDAVEAAAGNANHGRLTMLAPRKLAATLLDWRAWITGGGAPPESLLGLLSRGWIVKKNKPEFEHWALPPLIEWLHACASFENGVLPRARAQLLGHARRWVLERTDQALRQNPSTSFDQVLRQLSQMIDEPDSMLPGALAAQYPLALIDEFQDTDPTQWGMFKRIYYQRTGAALVLIGDPKQAIYSFRGADIHAYLDAKRLMGEQVYRMGVNYRSDPGLVDACNAVFEQPAGAFMVASADGVGVTYDPVAANRSESGLSGVGGMASMQWLVGSECGITKHVQEITLMSAQSVASMLGSRMMIGTPPRPIQPADVAVLVRKGSQANRMRKALAAVGVTSVYLSDRESLFAQPEALDILAWLKVAADPTDARVLKAALLSASIGLSWQELDALVFDITAWEGLREQVLVWAELAGDGDIQKMLGQVLSHFGVRERLLAVDRGARALANWMHLMEWAQASRQQLDSVGALIVEFERMMLDPGDTDIQRMESDQDVVRIVTVHKSKGLEYPVVVVPYLCVADAVGASDPAIVVRVDQQAVISVAGSTAQPELWQQADEARLQEDVRLLYVALTRARHLAVIGAVGLNKGMQKTALGAVLGVSDGASLDERLGQLSAFADVHVCHGPIDLPPGPQGDAVYTPASALQARFRLPKRRWIASFSSLGRRADADDQSHYSSVWDDEARGDASDYDPSAPGIAGFARGPEAGTFLHDVLERAHGMGFARAINERQWLGVMAEQRGFGDQVERLDGWLTQMLSAQFTGFGAAPLSLMAEPPAQSELEFLMAAGSLAIDTLDVFCQRHILPGLARPALSRGELNGYLKGYIDFVVEWEGRYWVLDWKSNYLGPDSQHYHRDAINQSILEHRYDVQYALYLVALHRHLSLRLADYHPGYHLGGAAYVFLRGLQGPEQGLHWCRGDLDWVGQLSELLS